MLCTVTRPDLQYHTMFMCLHFKVIFFKGSETEQKKIKVQEIHLEVTEETYIHFT